MHFGLTDEQKLLQQTLRDLAAGELPPNRRRELFDEGAGFASDLWRSTAEMGLAGLTIPEEHGGAGLEMLDLALAFEVIGEAALPGPYLGHALASVALVHGGSDAQQAAWLPRLATGDVIGTVALCEAGDVWDAAGWQTKESGGALSGAKRYVEHGDDAKLIVVGTAGGGLALVEAGDRVGVERADGIDRTRRLTHLDFDAAPAEALPRGESAAQALRDAACILLGADAFGSAWKLIQMTVEYTLQREQFGTRLAQFQSVKHELANLAMRSEPMRGLFWYAAYAFDHIEAERAREAAVVKAHITDTALDVARSAVELHGGIGFTWECDVQFWVKRAMFDRTWLGSPRAHRERIAQLASW
jgi:alkylation response protein AidB-like acyl-CoA dehydrogenase